MKKFLISVFTLFFLSLSANTPDPLLVIILMVKNEEAAMQPTLQPFIAAGIQSYLILDTGSTDNTISVTESLFKRHHITQGYVVEQPFIDFATSRNYAFKCAEEKFPNAAFFLMIDAEWIMHNVDRLLRFCLDSINIPINSYLLRINLETSDFFVHRLIRPKKDIWYTGAVHEILNPLSEHKAPHDVFFTLKNTHYGVQKTQERFLRDRILLHKKLEENPHDTHAMYYLGQTYAGLGDYDNAIKYFEMYCSLGGRKEFDFMTHCRLGDLYQYKNNWPKALYYYLEAYNMRPTRAEPLTCIADYYCRHEQFVTSFLFAKKAIEIPYPENDILLIDKNIYEYVRYKILAQSAYSIGEYEVGKLAVNQALKARPNDPDLQNIFNLYLERKLKKEFK